MFKCVRSCPILCIFPKQLLDPVLRKDTLFGIHRGDNTYFSTFYSADIELAAATTNQLICGVIIYLPEAKTKYSRDARKFIERFKSHQNLYIISEDTSLTGIRIYHREKGKKLHEQIEKIGKVFAKCAHRVLKH